MNIVHLSYASSKTKYCTTRVLHHILYPLIKYIYIYIKKSHTNKNSKTGQQKPPVRLHKAVRDVKQNGKCTVVNALAKMQLTYSQESSTRATVFNNKND